MSDMRYDLLQYRLGILHKGNTVRTYQQGRWGVPFSPPLFHVLNELQHVDHTLSRSETGFGGLGLGPKN